MDGNSRNRRKRKFFRKLTKIPKRRRLYQISSDEDIDAENDNITPNEQIHQNDMGLEEGETLNDRENQEDNEHQQHEMQKAYKGNDNSPEGWFTIPSNWIVQEIEGNPQAFKKFEVNGMKRFQQVENIEIVKEELMERLYINGEISEHGS